MKNGNGGSKQRILLITASRQFGGTNTSANNFINLIKTTSDFEVFLYPVDSSGSCTFPLDAQHQLPENPFYSMYVGKTKFVFARVGRIFFRGIFCCCRIFGYRTTDLLYHVLGRALEKFKFDVVVGFQQSAPTHVAANVRGCRRLAWIRCDYDRYRAVSPDSRERRYYEKMDGIVCVSDYTRGTFLSGFPEFTEKTVALHNLIDSERILRMAEDRSGVDARFQTDAFTVLSVGRLDPVKQFDRIPDIAQKLKARGLAFRWYILGGGVEEARIRAEIARCGVEDCVLPLGATGNPYAYMAQSDLYVCTSYSEACPNVINESRILHIPIVSTDFPSAKEFLREGENGYLASIDALDEPIARLMTDRGAYDAIKTNIAGFRYDNKAILARILEILTPGAAH